MCLHWLEFEILGAGHDCSIILRMAIFSHHCVFGCAFLQILEGNKYLLQALGSGVWPVMVLLSEIVQTFILADFWWVTAFRLSFFVRLAFLLPSEICLP